jgi:hypothetical protein
MNVKFCVNLENNVSYTCTVLFEAYGGEAVKNPSVFEWHKQFSVVLHVEITNEDNVHHFL